MKRVLFLITAVVIFFALTNCGSKDNGGNSNNNNNLVTQLTASKWKVHYFFYINDQTKQLGDYVFTFKADSSLTVSNTTDTYGGAWYTKDNAGSKFITINVRSLTQVQLLNSDWKVLSNDGTLLQLKETTNGTNADLHLIKQ
jgi:hypothetical protein